MIVVTTPHFMIGFHRAAIDNKLSNEHGKCPIWKNHSLYTDQIFMAIPIDLSCATRSQQTMGSKWPRSADEGGISR